MRPLTHEHGKLGHVPSCVGGHHRRTIQKVGVRRVCQLQFGPHQLPPCSAWVGFQRQIHPEDDFIQARAVVQRSLTLEIGGSGVHASPHRVFAIAILVHPVSSDFECTGINQGIVVVAIPFQIRPPVAVFVHVEEALTLSQQPRGVRVIDRSLNAAS